MSKHLLISYPHEERDFSELLQHKLESVNIPTWIDFDGIRASDKWLDKIEQAIQDAFAIVVVITPEAKMSEYVTYEWIFAKIMGIKIIPLLLKQTSLPKVLETYQCLDFTDFNNRPWSQLIKDIQHLSIVENYPRIIIPENAPTPIKKALLVLNNSDITRQEDAINFLIHTRDPIAYKILKNYKHPFFDIQLKLALFLAKYKDTSVIHVLINAFHNSIFDIRFQIIHALIQIGTPEILPGLILALQDSNKGIREIAAKALLSLNSKEKSQEILKILQDPLISTNILYKDILNGAIQILGLLKDPIAIKDLAGNLNSLELEIRRTTTFALGSIGSRSAIEEMLPLLHDSDSVTRCNVIKSLANLKREEISEAIISYLFELLYNNDVSVQNQTTLTLAEIGIKSAIPKIIHLLENTDSRISNNAAKALVNYKSLAVPQLASIFYTSSPETHFLIKLTLKNTDTNCSKSILIEHKKHPCSICKIIKPNTTFIKGDF